MLLCGIQLALGVVLYIGISAKAHAFSEDFLNSKHGFESVGYSKFQNTAWKSVRRMKMSCGNFFVINIGTVLVSASIIVDHIVSALMITAKYADL